MADGSSMWSAVFQKALRQGTWRKKIKSAKCQKRHLAQLRQNCAKKGALIWHTNLAQFWRNCAFSNLAQLRFFHFGAIALFPLWRNFLAQLRLFLFLYCAFFDRLNFSIFNRTFTVFLMSCF